MSAESKSLLIELFVRSHLVLSSITEERLKARSRAILDVDEGQDNPDITRVSDYSSHLEFVRELVVKALVKHEKSLQPPVSEKIDALIHEVQNAASGEEIFWLIETMPG